MENKLTTEMKEVVIQVANAERLRIAGDVGGENEALDLLEQLCDELSLDDLFIALRHVASVMSQKASTH